MDPEILQALASSHPEWQIVIVGPVVTSDPASLPRAENIHYLGEKPYPELPAYMAGWDLALMPFALNAPTRFISPTKVLKYMAADCPIVSTPIADVADLYSEIVYLGRGPEGFVRACEKALSAPEVERGGRRTRARQILSEGSWDDTARRMNEIISSVTGEKPMRRFVTSEATEVLENSG